MRGINTPQRLFVLGLCLIALGLITPTMLVAYVCFGVSALLIIVAIGRLSRIDKSSFIWTGSSVPLLLLLAIGYFFALPAPISQLARILIIPVGLASLVTLFFLRRRREQV